MRGAFLVVGVIGGVTAIGCGGVSVTTTLDAGMADVAAPPGDDASSASGGGCGGLEQACCRVPNEQRCRPGLLCDASPGGGVCRARP